MTIMIRPNADNLDALTITTGTVVSANRVGDPATFGCTLGVSTYYFPIGSSDAPTASETPLASAHVKWAAAVAATITVETTNFPARVGGVTTGPVDVTDYDSTAGNWQQENPSTAIVGVTGTGNSSTAATVTAGGTNAGCCTFHLADLGTRRARIKVVTTVGGLMRVGTHGKCG